MNILHIDASLRRTGSVSREMSQDFIDQLNAHTPCVIDRLDLAIERLDHIKQIYVEAMYTPYGQHSKEQLKELELSDALVDRVLQADMIVIGTPTYNFGVPSQLKTFIDLIVRSGRTFQYTEKGFEGLLTNKKVVVFNSRGLSYKDAYEQKNDHVTGYLNTILGFIGIHDVQVIHLGPTFFGPEAVEQAKRNAQQLMADLINRL